MLGVVSAGECFCPRLLSLPFFPRRKGGWPRACGGPGVARRFFSIIVLSWFLLGQSESRDAQVLHLSPIGMLSDRQRATSLILVSLLPGVQVVGEEGCAVGHSERHCPLAHRQRPSGRRC